MVRIVRWPGTKRMENAVPPRMKLTRLVPSFSPERLSFSRVLPAHLQLVELRNLNPQDRQQPPSHLLRQHLNPKDLRPAPSNLLLLLLVRQHLNPKDLRPAPSNLL